MLRRTLSFLCGMPLAILALNAAAIELQATFTGGAYGTWDFAYLSGPAGLTLSQITIDLSRSNRRFDTAAGGAGVNEWLDIGSVNGTDAATGLSAIWPGTGTALDGGPLLTLEFVDFGPGEWLRFHADVDGPAPAPLNLPPCPDGYAGLFCNVNRVALYALYDLEVFNASNTIGPQMAGSRVTYTFKGGLVLTDGFWPGDGVSAASRILVNEVAIPETKSWHLLAAGLILIAIGRGSRPSRASR